MSDNPEKVFINFECNFCGKILSSISSLNLHKKTAKYCLKIQNKNASIQHQCDICNKNFILKDTYLKHFEKCSNELNSKKKTDIIKEYENLMITHEKCIKKNKKVVLKYTKKISELENRHKISIEIFETKIRDLETKYEERIKDLETKHKEHITELESHLADIALKASGSCSDNFPDIIVTAEEEEEEEEEEDEEEKIEIIKENTFKDISTLKINDTYQIECRQEDGYINVTNLCKAGNKQFKHWNSLEKTKSFIRVLSSSVGIPTDELIAYKEGSIHERATWVHPQVAINIAQWISPQFDVQVSGWVYEIMITGKVDIKNTKSYKELHKENKCKDLRIKHLENKYVKKQKRIQYKEEFVMYILTTPFNKSSGIYTLGIASNFTNRLSTYNKSEEHEVIYYQSCGSEDTMKLVENMVFKKLENYRCQANKEKFQLKPDINITFFIDKIKECIGFFN